jgi:hypothetical protein
MRIVKKFTIYAVALAALTSGASRAADRMVIGENFTNWG